MNNMELKNNYHSVLKSKCHKEGCKKFAYYFGKIEKIFSAIETGKTRILPDKIVINNCNILRKHLMNIGQKAIILKTAYQIKN
jgi:hypothetical protein